jgi:hypothetical protein
MQKAVDLPGEQRRDMLVAPMKAILVLLVMGGSCRPVRHAVTVAAEC